jgi:hypothetical protein
MWLNITTKSPKYFLIKLRNKKGNGPYAVKSKQFWKSASNSAKNLLTDLLRLILLIAVDLKINLMNAGKYMTFFEE